MFLVDAPGPATGKFVFERLWLALAGKWVALNVADEASNAERLSAILPDPPSQVLKRGGVEFEGPSQGKFLNNSIEWETVRALRGRHQTLLHRLRLQEIGRFPL